MLRSLAALTAVAVVYFIAGKLGLRLAYLHASATPVWPPTGIALAALLIFGYRVWPAILVSAFFVNLTTAGSIATSIGISVGNTLEGLVGAYLVNRFANGRHAFNRARDTFKLALLAAVFSTMVSATTGVTTLSVGGFARWADFGSIWMTWWLGDAVGALVVAPLVLLWSARPQVRWSARQIIEAAALLLGLGLVGLTVFGGLFPSTIRNYPLEFLSIPFLIWAAFRFGPREVATAIGVLSAIAISGTLRGFGPFARSSPNESLLLLQAFIAVTAVMTLALAAIVSERKQMEAQLRTLVVSDPLTGLANYRRLMSALDAEIERCQRTGRPFAIVFLDLDRLKKINDRYGHLVGSRALCRVAEVLHTSCRAVDTAARFGGDEFAVILPETDQAAAARVASRIVQRCATDGEKPALSVSVGVGMYAFRGETAEALLSAADTLLYDAKARRGANDTHRG